MTKETEKKKQPTCQNCKYQSNKPSYCGVYKKHVGRKAPICGRFSR